MVKKSFELDDELDRQLRDGLYNKFRGKKMHGCFKEALNEAVKLYVDKLKDEGYVQDAER